MWRIEESNVGEQASFRGGFNVVPGISVWCIMQYVIFTV